MRDSQSRSACKFLELPASTSTNLRTGQENIYRQSDFLNQLRHLLSSQVEGMTETEKAEAVRTLVGSLEGSASALPSLDVVPFIAGRRPVDEASHHGLGSSDNAGLILEGSRWF